MLLEEQHIMTTFRETAGGHGAGRAATNDDDITQVKRRQASLPGTS